MTKEEGHIKMSKNTASRQSVTWGDGGVGWGGEIGDGYKEVQTSNSKMI